MRAQVFSLDFIISVFIFFLIFSIGLQWWNSTKNDLSEGIISSDIEHRSDAILQLLITTKGSPYNWGLNAEQYGLADDMYYLSGNKVDKFVNYSIQNYNTVKENLGIASYEFNLKIKSPTKGLLYDTGRFPAYVEEIVRTVRVAYLDGEVVEVEFLMWKG